MIDQFNFGKYVPSTYYVRNVMGARCRYSAHPPVVYTSQKEGRDNADSSVLRILSTGAREASWRPTGLQQGWLWK